MILQAKNIKKSFGNLQVVKDANITINKGEIASIVGSSGAGKSTLLHILGTLEKPDDGEIIINNTQISPNLSDKELANFRNKEIGFIFQNNHLLPEFTALENVCIPGFIAGRKKSEVIEKAKEILNYLGLSERLNHQPSKLSGGEQQRTAVARALINTPSIILADEPTGNLDSKNAVLLHELFEKFAKDFNQSFLIVTHNQDLAKRANKVFTMQDGTIL